jgi:hypothetical protein
MDAAHQIHVINFVLYKIHAVPDMAAGYCLGSEGNGVSLEERGEGGPGPSPSGKDKQSVFGEGRDNMEKDEEDQTSQT